MNRLLLRHRLVLALLAASMLVGAVCAKLNTSGNLQVASATTHVMIDDSGPSIVDRSALSQDLSTLQARAELYGRLMTTTPVLAAIGKRADLPPDQISGVADITANAPIQFTQAGSEERATQIRASRAPYRLELQADPYEPILTIYSEAPSVNVAVRLANSAILGLQDYLRKLARQQRFPEAELPQLHPLGSARGGVSSGSAMAVIGGLTFITAFALSFVGLLVLVRRPWRRRQKDVPRPPSRLTGRAAADWPRTTRLLPWSIAGLITMFWLTPFDRIQLKVSAPINITLDRVVLPIVAVIWLISFWSGPGAAPRLRITRVHLAAGAFLACAFLSTVLDAHYLNHTGELMLSLKRLPLLVSYLAVFVIVTSSVRRSEVPAFMTFTLVLAMIVGLEVVYEFHSHQDLFDTLSRAIFRYPFEVVDNTNASIFDSQGRAWIEGPSSYGVELITMLSIALPVGFLGILKSKTRRQHIFYGFAIMLLLYAMFATDRKSALIVPAAVLVTLAYFRRRELLLLAPVCLVIVVVAVAVSPATIGNVVSQFTASDAGSVPTVSSRTANYDAIRPDLWTHLILGRGQGTYAPPTDRVVDSEIILRLVETGVLGLVTFLLIPVCVILVTVKTASGRDPRWSAPALSGVAAAVCFIVVATLYSVMSAPHGPDVFFYFAGLAVVVAGPDRVPTDAPRMEREDAFAEHRSGGRKRLGSVRERAALGG